MTVVLYIVYMLLLSIYCKSICYVLKFELKNFCFLQETSRSSGYIFFLSNHFQQRNQIFAQLFFAFLKVMPIKLQILYVQ